MYRFLGTNWTSDSLQDDMLEVLRRQTVSRIDFLKKFRVEGVHLTAKLIAGHKASTVDLSITTSATP
jgi:hypothetical protein